MRWRNRNNICVDETKLFTEATSKWSGTNDGNWNVSLSLSESRSPITGNAGDCSLVWKSELPIATCDCGRVRLRVNSGTQVGRTARCWWWWLVRYKNSIAYMYSHQMLRFQEEQKRLECSQKDNKLSLSWSHQHNRFQKDYRAEDRPNIRRSLINKLAQTHVKKDFYLCNQQMDNRQSKR